MTVLSTITEPAVLGKILGHLGLPTCAPAIAPARLLDEGSPELDLGPCRARRRLAPASPMKARSPPETDGQLDAEVDLDADLRTDDDFWGA